MAPGVKRPATDDLEGEQRLAKRFDLLHLEPQERNGKLFIPPPPTSNDVSANNKLRARLPRLDDEWMDIEDTKYKTYIHDLDKELEEVESDEERPIFVPDIEKHLMKIPQHVLQSTDDKKALLNQQLVLYGTPTSLSIPENKDSVRRAIIEARQRARETQALRPPTTSTAIQTTPKTNGHDRPPRIATDFPAGRVNGLANGFNHSTPNEIRMEDPDAMDIG